MDYIGVMYVIRGIGSGIYGYVFKSYSERKYIYIPKHKVNKHKVLFKHCNIEELPFSVGVGMNSKILKSRLELSDELSRLIWYLLNSGINPAIIYETLGMSHKEVEGLSSGPEAFTISTKGYIELGRKLIQRLIELNFDINFDVMFEELRLKSLNIV